MLLNINSECSFFTVRKGWVGSPIPEAVYYEVQLKGQNNKDCVTKTDYVRIKNKTLPQTGDDTKNVMSEIVASAVIGLGLAFAIISKKSHINKNF